MPKQSEDIMNNPVLYNYLQLAYEHAQAFSEESLAGEATEFLGNLYGRRLDSVLDELDDSDPPLFAGVGALGEWLAKQRLRWSGAVLTGQINDLYAVEEAADLLEKELTEHEQRFERDTIGQAFHELGVEAYATYLPIHFFFDGDPVDTAWGIYVSEQGVMRLASMLRREYRYAYGDPAPGTSHRLVEMAYQILLRHELEHYKIEAFALNAEMYLERAVYVPYLSQVYRQLYPGEGCLEEGLSNAAVLNSVAVRNVFREMYPPEEGQTTPNWQRVVMEHFFSNHPPAYSNYRLEHGWEDGEDRTSPFGNRRRAMNYLCNQIVRGTPEPEVQVPYYAFPPDNYFLRAENLVPIHVVSSLDRRSFLRVPVPTSKEWEEFLSLVGYEPTDRGKGSHTVWRAQSGLPDLTIRYHGKELDFNSFKTSLSQLELSMHEFNQHKSNKRGRKRLAKKVKMGVFVN